MFRRLRVAVLASLILAAATACGGDRIFGERHVAREALQLRPEVAANLAFALGEGLQRNIAPKSGISELVCVPSDHVRHLVTA